MSWSNGTITVDDLMKVGTSKDKNISPMLEYSREDSIIPGLTNGGLAGLGQITGIGGTLLNTYDNLWGNKADLFKTQISALKQNAANVAEDKANHRTFVANLGGGINSAFKPGSGLAASGSTVNS